MTSTRRAPLVIVRHDGMHVLACRRQVSTRLHAGGLALIAPTNRLLRQPRGRPTWLIEQGTSIEPEEDRFKFFAVAPDGTVWQLDERGERLIHRIAGDEWPTSPWRVDGLQANGLGPIALEGIDMDFPTSTFTAA